jgi:hypothetical protein
MAIGRRATDHEMQATVRTHSGEHDSLAVNDGSRAELRTRRGAQIERDWRADDTLRGGGRCHRDCRHGRNGRKKAKKRINVTPLVNGRA